MYTLLNVTKILHTIYLIRSEYPEYDQINSSQFTTEELPDRTKTIKGSRNLSGGKTPAPEIQLVLANLEVLGCLYIPRGGLDTQHFNTVRQTLLGSSFVDACTLSNDSSPI